jgi:hypothetical protein
MDELFEVADFHGLEDAGTAAKHGGDAEKNRVERIGAVCTDDVLVTRRP